MSESCVSIQISHSKDRDLPPVPEDENLSASPTKSETSNKESTSKDTSVDISSEGYSLLSSEQPKDEADDTGYDEVNDQDVISSHYEMNYDLLGKENTEDDNDYEEPYWEPANKEEELMVQLAKLNVLIIATKDIE